MAWEQPDTIEVQANTNYQWIFTPADSSNHNSISHSIELWHLSTGGGSSDGSSSGNKTETTKNPDGSTTTITTD